jgi:hypothetical protein
LFNQGWKKHFNNLSEVKVPEKIGRKDDLGKLRWDLLPIEQIEQVVAVLTHGAIKYGDYNWEMVSNPGPRYYAAAMRHIVDWRKNKIKDSDSGIAHLAHAICCLLFLMWFDDLQKTVNIPISILKAAAKLKQISSIKIAPVKLDKKIPRVSDKSPKGTVKGVVGNLAARGLGCSNGKRPVISKTQFDRRPRTGGRRF